MQHADITYRELHGRLEPGSLSAAGAASMLDRDAVILSNFEQGTASSQPVDGLCIRYVARGCENYRIAGRGYRVEAGQVMISPQDQGAECEIRNVDRTGTLGMCTLVRVDGDELGWAFGPLVLGGSSPLGPMLKKSVEALWNSSRAKQEVARELVASLRGELPSVASSILAQLAAVDGAKPGTRFEMVRRANFAQAYLHSITDRTVDLEEVSMAVGISSFRLLTAFQQCFGATPASYHRKLRLTLALDEARRRGVRIDALCDEFGFASASSFSHAYRRAFGHAPLRSSAIAKR